MNIRYRIRYYIYDFIKNILWTYLKYNMYVYMKLKIFFRYYKYIMFFIGLYKIKRINILKTFWLKKKNWKKKFQKKISLNITRKNNDYLKKRKIRKIKDFLNKRKIFLKKRIFLKKKQKKKNKNYELILKFKKKNLFLTLLDNKTKNVLIKNNLGSFGFKKKFKFTGFSIQSSSVKFFAKTFNILKNKKKIEVKTILKKLRKWIKVHKYFIYKKHIQIWNWHLATKIEQARKKKEEKIKRKKEIKRKKYNMEYIRN